MLSIAGFPGLKIFKLAEIYGDKAIPIEGQKR
jgi:hypothetical protein